MGELARLIPVFMRLSGYHSTHSPIHLKSGHLSE